MYSPKKIFLLLLLIFAIIIFAQSKPVYEMLGKSVSTVINTYGKPAMHDKSDPLLEMVFYKTDNLQLCFVATNNSVFQAEMTKGFSSKGSAVNLFNEYVNDLFAAGMTEADSSELKRSFHGDNKMIDLEVFNNTVKKSYEVKVKAQKY